MYVCFGKDVAFTAEFDRKGIAWASGGDELQTRMRRVLEVVVRSKQVE
jgi:hypothetical protein